MGRSTTDYREFVKIAVDLPDNPKLGLIDDPAAGWAYVVAICYCRQHLTDGSFPLVPLLRRAGVKRSVADRLIDVQLWHDTGHACDRCPQPIPGMAVVHDYLLHQQSADEVHTLRDARREAGRKGAASRWHGNGDGKSHSNSHGTSHDTSHGNSHDTCHGKPMATGVAETWQLDGMSMAELEEEEELKKKTSSSSSARGRKKPETRLPASWRPTSNHRAYAAEHHLDLDVQAQLFRAHAEEHDRRAVVWNGAFTRWLINAAEYQRRNQQQRDQRRPPLRSVSGGYQPFQGPRNESDYDKPMWPEEQP